MTETRAAERVAVRFLPEERLSLLESLGPERSRFSGLGLAELDGGWHVCWLGRGEAAELEACLAGPGSPVPAGPRRAALRRLGDRRENHQAKPSRSRAAGLLLAGLFLSAPDESVTLPRELVPAAGLDAGGDQAEAPGARLGRLMAASADLPLPDLGGMSPRAFGRLVSHDWLAPDGPLSLSLELEPAELEQAPVMLRAQALLDEMARREPIAADRERRLPLGLVLELCEDPIWRDRPGRGPWAGPGLPGEDQAGKLWATRAMLQDAGLVQLWMGSFSLTPLGHRLRAEGAGAELYARLFRSRMLCGAGFPGAWRTPPRRFHRAMAFHLHRLLQAPAGGHLSDWLIGWATLPAWLYGRAPSGRTEPVAPLARSRLLAPLLEFGLLVRERPRDIPVTAGQWAYRATGLLGRFMRVAA
jgi:hypothetical protein